MDTSDQAYRDLVEEQQDLIVKISLEGRLLFVNTIYAGLLGKAKDELCGSVFMPVSGERYSDVVKRRAVWQRVHAGFGRAVF